VSAWKGRGIAVGVSVLALCGCGDSSREPDASAGEAGDGGRSSAGTAGSAGAAGRGGLNSGGAGNAGAGGTGRGGAGGGGLAGGGASAGSAGKAGAGGGAGQSDQGGHAGTGTAGTGTAGSADAGTGGDSGELPAPLRDAVRAFCAAAESCCASAGLPAMLEECESMYAMYQSAVPSIESGAVTLDEAALARCEAAYAEGPDRCNLNAVVAACRGAFIGHRGVDQPCGDGYDCDRSEGPMTCVISDTMSPTPMGLCKQVPRATLGSSCQFTCYAGEDCSSTTFGSSEALTLCFEDDGLWCDTSGDEPVCRAIIALGEACEGYDDCGSKAYCETVCKPRSGLGELCDYACLRQFQCGDDGRCRDPLWATESACMGYAPGP
jgi:hypothetical protein